MRQTPAHPRLRVLRLPERVGSETARRIGAEAALGDVVWFVDDDVVPAPGCGRGHVDAHVSTGADIVVGELNTPAGADRSCSGRPVRIVLFSTNSIASSTIQRRFFWHSGQGNHSVRRASLVQVAPIPPVFRGTNHSDRAFGLSCLRAGLTGRGSARTEGRPQLQPNGRCVAARMPSPGRCRREIHRHFADLLGPRRGRSMERGPRPARPHGIRIARRGLAPARVVAGVVGQLMKGDVAGPALMRGRSSSAAFSDRSSSSAVLLCLHAAVRPC
jgi:hypothetical protein